VRIGLSAEQITLAERLREAGYHTGMVGKWHLGSGSGMHPLDQGFEEYFGILGGGSAYFGKDGQPLMVTRGRERVEEHEYLTDAFGREAAAFVTRHPSQPWFLYLAFNAVHDPMQPKPSDLPRVPTAEGKLRKPYAAMLVAMDDAIGRVLNQLRQTGADTSTLVILLNDNGGPTAPINSNVNGSRNGPFRGGKRQLSEGGIRVPMFASWPGVIAPHTIVEQPVSSLDVLPTVLEAAKIETPDQPLLEGLNLLPLIAGQTQSAKDRTLCWRFGWQYAIRRGEWKLVRWKHDDGAAFTEGLFHLGDDPGETRDVRSDHPELAEALAEAWREWNLSNEPPAWGTPGELDEAAQSREAASQNQHERTPESS
jgi:arylsulfatase A-like enzyme